MRGLALVEALALGHTTCRAHSRTTSWKDVDRPVSFSSSAYSFKLKDGVEEEGLGNSTGTDQHTTARVRATLATYRSESCGHWHLS